MVDRNSGRNGEMPFLDGRGRPVAKKGFPNDFLFDKIRTFPDHTVIFDAGGNRKIVLPRSFQPTSAIPDLAIQPSGPDDKDSVDPHVVRRSHRWLGIVPYSGAGFSKELEVRGVTPGYLASATFLGTDSEGRAYSLARELEIVKSTESVVGHKPTEHVLRYQIHARLTIGRHDSNGVRTHVADIPLDNLSKIPSGHYVSVEPDGSAVALLPNRIGESAHDILYRPSFIQETSRKDTNRPLKAASVTAEELEKAAPISRDPVLSDEGMERIELMDTPVDNEPKNIAGRRSIAMMKRAAERLINFKWTALPGNLLNKPDCAIGRKDPAHAFELPLQLRQVQPGTVVRGIPYSFGGRSNLENISNALHSGEQAGNICSELKNEQPNVTGLDCSGFVAQVWGVDKFDTTNTHKISTPVLGLNQLRWGDVFNRPGKHIMLYVGQEDTEDEGLRFLIMESSALCGGTCMMTYPAEQPDGFELRRLRSKH
jgi:cell wall-associated NlpC family hydrolase